MPDIIDSPRNPDEQPLRRRRILIASAAALTAVATGAAVVVAVNHSSRERPSSLPTVPPTPSSTGFGEDHIGTSPPTPPPLLRGVTPRPEVLGPSILLLGGDHLWIARPAIRLSQVIPDSLLATPSPLGGSPFTRTLLPVHGGAVVLVANETSSGPQNGVVELVSTAGRIVRTIGKANNAVAAATSGRVWLQTAGALSEQPGAPNRTWLIDLHGSRVAGPLNLPGQVLLADTSAGLLSKTANGLVLADPSTGRKVPLPLPAEAQYVAATPNRIAYLPACQATGCAVDLIDLRTHTIRSVRLPLHTSPCCTPVNATLDRSGTRLLIPLSRSDSSGTQVEQSVYVADFATGRITELPGGPVNPATDTLLTGAWSPTGGSAWLLATSSPASSSSRYQLSFWPGHGPLQVFTTTDGSPFALIVLG